MEEAPPRDGTFQLVPSATPGVFDFKVAVNYQTPSPSSAIAAGTAYSAVTAQQMAIRPYVGAGWDAYVAAQSEPAGTRVFWQHFVASLPTTPRVTEGPFDPIWGRTRNHTYMDLVTATRPDRADLFSTSSTTLTLDLVAGGTWEWVSFGAIELASVRPVLDAQERDMQQGLCAVTVVTVDNPSVQKNEDVVDPQTGEKKIVSKIHVLSATSPAGYGVQSDGSFAEVTPVEHNHWLMVVDKATTLPTSRATAQTWETHGKIYWPAVLEWWSFWTVYDPDHVPVDELFSHSMRDPYAGDVRVTVRKWWQSTPYDVGTPVNLLPSSIRIDGALNNISLPESLHADFDYNEETYTPYADTLPNGTAVTTYVVTRSRWHFEATSPTDWPNTVTKIDQTDRNGGYEIVESIYHRPDFTPRANTVENSSYIYTDTFA